MKVLLSLLVVSSLLAGSHGWDNLWSDIKESLGEAKDKIQDGWDQHVDPLLDDVKDSWDDHVQPFFDEIAAKAKAFVTGKKDDFKAFSDDLKEKSQDLDKCRGCAESGTCTAEEDEECEEMYGVFSKVFEFYNCMKAKESRKCIDKMGEEEDEKMEMSGDKAVSGDEDKSSEKDASTVTERRARLLLRELLKTNA